MSDIEKEIDSLLNIQFEPSNKGPLSLRHREVARRLVCGQKPPMVKQDMDISDVQLNNLMKNPIFQNEIKRLQMLREEDVRDLNKSIAEIAPVALTVRENLMYKAGSEKLRADIAGDFLDRAGYSPKRKMELDVTDTGEMAKGLIGLMGLIRAKVEEHEKPQPE